MRSLLSLLWVLPFWGTAQPFLENKTYTYEELLSQYKKLDSQNEQATLFEMGPTDSGRKLHLLVLSNEGVSSLEEVKTQAGTKAVLLINNGIHPGESCGIDASLKFAKDLLAEKALPSNVLIAIVPVYNIGGMLNRNAHSRANQLGPEEHGFRGNARNLDLNRDFIKADALNTFSFYSIFHLLKPHVFIDTHTSNGADYQYTITLITPQKDKLNPVLSAYLAEDMEPALYKDMSARGWEMSPYVNVFGTTPDKGMSAFLETPRYASGYAALFNTLGFITETHMLKPYADRVLSTYTFLRTLTAYVSRESEQLKALKKRATAYDQNQAQLAVDWKLDSSRVQTLPFKGYAYTYEESALHNQKRLKYLQDRPQTYEVDYYEHYMATEVASVPEFYVVPQAYKEIPLRLQYNDVQMRPLLRDTLMEVESWYLTDFSFARAPYEGHIPLQQLTAEKRIQKRKFYKGDWLVYTNQPGRRFIVNTLHPTAVDAYLRWNFFDAIFQQKEWFSAYVFEDTAAELLENDPSLKAKYEAWLAGHPNAGAFRSLYFIYRNSDYYEPEHMRYPVAGSMR